MPQSATRVLPSRADDIRSESSVLAGIGAKPVRDPSRSRRPFLQDITIDYGPRELLANYFLHAQAEVRKRGITLVFSDLHDLLDVNRQNSDTWLPIVSIFNPEHNVISPGDSYCILGLNAAGEVVATQAVRIFRWHGSSLADEAQTMRLFYSDPDRQMLPGEACTITAPSARNVRGLVAYSGGVWYRPDYRKLGLTAFMPRVARAYALARWSTDMTMTLMAEGIVKSGVAERVGYPNVEWEARFHNNALAGPRFALLWMSTDQLLSDLDRNVGSFRDSEVDAVIQHGAA